MPTIDDILRISTPGEFEAAAMGVFRRQALECAPYRDYLEAVGIQPQGVTCTREIPFLPIELFKTHHVFCGGGEPEAVFTSSGASASRHYVRRLEEYERVFTRGFGLFYGDAADWSIRSLLPCYREREGSSLVYMVDGLQKMGRPDAGKRLLIGVSYALLDLAEEFSATGERLPKGTVVMETGGMKGRREEMPRARMHEVLCRAFGVHEIHSEYGMAELTSQGYSSGGGIFRTPPWMRVSVRDLADPFDVKESGRGGIDIIDLGNLYSCAFIQTQDVGTVVGPGGDFTIDGRVARSDIRGCNLLVQ